MWSIWSVWSHSSVYIIWQKEDYPGGPNLITSPVKALFSSGWWAEREVKETRSMRSTCCTDAALKMEGPAGEGVQKASRSREQSPAHRKEMGPQIHSHKEPDSASNWVSLEAVSSPELPDKSPAQWTPWFQPCTTLSKKPSQAQASNLWNSEIVNSEIVLNS